MLESLRSKQLPVDVSGVGHAGAQSRAGPSDSRSLRRLAALVGLGAAAHLALVLAFRRQRSRYAGQRRHVLVTAGGQRLRLAGDEAGDAVVSVLMGGAILDLRNAALRNGPARLDLLVLMGGVSLLVPRHWKLAIGVEALMGGVADLRAGSDEDTDRPPDLVLCGRVVMGGLEITEDLQGARTRTR